MKARLFFDTDTKQPFIVNIDQWRQAKQVYDEWNAESQANKESPFLPSVPIFIITTETGVHKHWIHRKDEDYSEYME